MKTPFKRKPVDLTTFVASSGIRQVFRMNVCNSRGNSHGFRATVHAEKTRVGHTAWSCMADLPLDGRDKVHLVYTRGHDVCHHVRFVHGIQDGIRCMTEPQHAVAAAVVDDGALERNDPGTGTCQCDIRIDGVFRVKIRQSGMRAADLLVLIEGQELCTRLLELNEPLMSSVDGNTEISVGLQEIQNNFVPDTARHRGTPKIPHFVEAGELWLESARIGQLPHC